MLPCLVLPLVANCVESQEKGHPWGYREYHSPTSNKIIQYVYMVVLVDLCITPGHVAGEVSEKLEEIQ